MVLKLALLGMKSGPIGLGWLETIFYWVGLIIVSLYYLYLCLFKEIIVLVIGVQQDIM